MIWRKQKRTFTNESKSGHKHNVTQTCGHSSLLSIRVFGIILISQSLERLDFSLYMVRSIRFCDESDQSELIKNIVY